MTCRSCSQEIDDKAIVCYRCGAPAAVAPARLPAAGGARGRWGWMILIALVILAVAGYVWVYGTAS